MERRLWKSVLTFVLVLVLTVVTVATLSMATAAKTETAPARYSEEVRAAQAAPATELSAKVEEETASPLVSLAAFAMVLSIPVTGGAVVLHSRRKQNGPAKRRGARYSPRADMISRA